MSEFQVRSENVDVEHIMRQIRARIRDKRGVDYTEDEIRELANVKLEKFLDPKGIRSDLLQQYRRAREADSAPRNYAFEDTTLYESTRPLLRAIRRILNPLLKLFLNPNKVVEALHIQSRLNESYNRSEALYYELVHNLVLETTRLGVEVKNLKMRLESISSRLDFDERRARALEGVVQYRPGAATPLQPPTGQGNDLDADGNERRNRRRRRRGRRRPGAGEAGPGSAAEPTPADRGVSGMPDPKGRSTGESRTGGPVAVPPEPRSSTQGGPFPPEPRSSTQGGPLPPEPRSGTQAGPFPQEPRSSTRGGPVPPEPPSGTPRSGEGG